MPQLDDKQEAAPHSHLEDAIAIVVGALIVSLGLVFLKSNGALTGGTAGLAFLAHYYTGYSFGTVFFLINLPFYGLSLTQMGWAFTAKTLLTVTLVSVLVDQHSQFVTLSSVQPLFGVTMGGILIGVGLLILFRHRASVGGLNILSLYVQNKHNVSAGMFQLVADSIIVSLSVLVVTPIVLLYSIVGAVVLNLVIAMNHRPFRYMA